MTTPRARFTLKRRLQCEVLGPGGIAPFSPDLTGVHVAYSIACPRSVTSSETSAHHGARDHASREGDEKMTLWKVVTLVLVVAAIGARLVAGSSATWFWPAVRTVVLSLAPPLAMAIVLVAYFDWRARFKHRILEPSRSTWIS